jgi:hypothetical protein
VLRIETIRAELIAIEQWDARFPVAQDYSPYAEIGFLCRQIRHDELQALLKDLSTRN